jgi:hypothetical protein
LHVPPAHIVPDAQAIPQPPQFGASVIGFTHALAQLNLEPRQLDAHVPMSQTRPAEQTLAHAPQLNGSEDVSTQTPLHPTVPAGQTHAPLTHAKDGPQR